MINALTIESMTARSPGSLPIPQLRFSTSGRLRCSAKRAAYSIACWILPVIEMPPRASFAIFSPSSCAPGATPSKPATLNRVCPAAIPATCVPCALLSNTKASVGTPPDPPGAGERTAGHHHRAVPGGSDGREPHHTLPGEIPHVEQLGRAGAGDDQAVHPRVHSRVENADHNAAPVVRGVLGAE